MTEAERQRQEQERQRLNQEQQARLQQQDPPPEPQPTGAEEGQSQEQAEQAQYAYQQAMQQQRDEAERAIREAPVIGAEHRSSVPPPNAPASAVLPGPMTLRFAVKGLPIFHRYGKRYQVVQPVGDGVLAMDLEYSEPKPVVYMSAPGGHELEAAPEPK
jgi:hypothetical protein